MLLYLTLAVWQIKSADMGFVCIFWMSNPGLHVKETLRPFVRKTKDTVADG